MSDERLGGRDRHLQARSRVDDRVRLAGERRIDDVRHGDHARAATLRFARGLNRVDRLAALGHANDQRANLNDRVAVAVLARDVHLDAHPRPAFDGVLRHERGVVRRTGGDQDDTLDVAQFLVAHTKFVKDDAPVATSSIKQRRVNRFRLLVDLLGHEVVVATLFGRL